MALSVLLYAATWEFDLYLSAYPNGFWAFNPFAWQLLFVFGAWCAQGGAQRMSRILASPITLWISFAYLLFAFFVTLTWYVPQFSHLMPKRLEQWMYPISKTDLDVLRFAHFLALAALTVRFLPKDWPALKSPWLQTVNPLRPAFPGDLLSWRIPGLCRTFHPGGVLGRYWVAFRY